MNNNKINNTTVLVNTWLTVLTNHCLMYSSLHLNCCNIFFHLTLVDTVIEFPLHISLHLLKRKPVGKAYNSRTLGYPLVKITESHINKNQY